MTFQVAVRTYQRPELFHHATLSILRQFELTDRLRVFVGSDIEPYRTLDPDLTYVQAPVGGANAIRAICDYYPRGTEILFLDDDLESWYGGDLVTMCETGFRECDFFGFGFWNSKLYWDVLPAWGPKYSTLPGCAFAARNYPELITTTYSSCDDFVRTIQYFEAGILPMCYHHAGFKTRYAKNAGGMQASGDRNDTLAVAKSIMEVFPSWCKSLEQQSCGIWAPKMIAAATIKKRFRTR